MALPLRRLAGLLTIAAAFGCPKSVNAPDAKVAAVGTGVQIGQVVRLDASGSADAQGRDLSYAWQFTAIPIGSTATLNDAHSATPSFLADVDGEYDVQVVVSNAFVSAAAVTTRILVSKCGGRAPVFGTGGVTARDAARPATTNNFAVGATVVLASDVSDPDNATIDQVCTASQNQALTYSWKLIGQPAASAASLNNTTASSPSFVADVAGSYTIRLVATDSTNRSSVPFDQTLTVSPCGANAPTVTAVAPVTEQLAVGKTIQMTATPDDADNSTACQAVLGAPQTFSYQWSLPQLPNGSRTSLNSAVGQNPSFTPDIEGDYLVRVVLTDSTGRSSAAKDTAVKIPKCGNNAPVAAITSAGGGAAPSTGFLGILLQFGQRVQDLDQQAIGSTAAACNPPIPQSFSLKWSIVALPAGSAAQLNNPTGTNPSFTPDVAGTYTLQLVATDQSGLASAPATQSVLVKACGLTPPTITSIDTAPTSGATTVNSGTSVGVKAIAIDSDNSTGAAGCNLPAPQSLTYAWSLASRPSGSAAFISNPSQDPAVAPAIFTPDVANGTYQVQLVVTDSTGLKSAPGFFSVFTNSCGTNAPLIDSAGTASTLPDPGTLVTLTATGHDPDNGSKCSPALGSTGQLPVQTLSYRWTLVSRPAGSGAALTTAAATDGSVATFTPDVIGPYQFSVAVTDSTGRSSAASFVTVQTSTCGSHAPVIASATASSAPTPPRPTLDTVTLDDTGVTDADDVCFGGNQPKTFAWSVVSRPSGSSAVIAGPTGTVDPTTKKATATFVPDAPGTYQFQLVITDSMALPSAPAFVNLTASSCSLAAPIVASFTAAAATQFTSFTFPAPVVANNNCLPAAATNNYAWSIVAAPSGSSATLSNPAVPTPTFTPDKIGNYQFALTVTNGVGVAAAPVFFNLSAATCGNANLGWSSIGVIKVFDPDPAGTGTTFLGIAIPPNPSAGAQVTVSAVALDPNGACGTRVQPISYKWAIVAAPANSKATLTSNTDSSPAFVPDVPNGTYQLSVVATDALGNTSAAPNFITVTSSSCGAGVPVVAISPLDLTGPNSIFSNTPATPGSITASVTDPDNSCTARFNIASYTFAWSIASQPTNGRATLASASGASTNFVASVPGLYSLHVVATTPTGISSGPSGSFLPINVKACGSNAPLVNSVSAFAAPGTTTVLSRPAVGQAVNLVANATDADLICGAPGAAVVSYAWNAIALPSGSVAPSSFTSATTNIFNFTPDVAGTFTYSVVATDNTGLQSAPVNASISTATCAPAPAGIRAATAAGGFLPVSSANAVGTVNGFAISLDVPFILDSCVKQPSYAYSWSLQKPAGSQATLSTLSGAAPQFTPDVPGSYAVQLVVTDNAALVSAPATLTVNAANCGAVQPTIAGLLATPNAPNAGQAVTLSATSITDLNTCGSVPVQPYSYSWSLISAPAGSSARLSSQTAAAPQFVADVPNGTYQVTLTVTDQVGMVSAPAFITVTSSNCGAVPPTVAFVGASTVRDFTATQDLTVNGGVGLHLVHGSDVAKNLASGAGATLVPLYPAVPVQLAATVNPGIDLCAPSKTITYQWSIFAQPAGSASRINSPSAQFPSFTPDLPGVYDFQLVLTDQNGRSSTNLLSLDTTASSHPGSVSACGTHAPTAVANVVGPISGSTNQPLSLAAQLDAKGSQSPDDYRSIVSGSLQTYPTGCGLTLPLSYQWTMATSPAASTASLSSPTLSNPSFVPDLPGAYQVRMTASDGKNSASATATVNGVGGYATTPAATGAVFSATTTDGSGNPVVAWWDNSSGTVAAAQCTSNCSGANPSWKSLGTIDSGLSLMTLPTPDDEPRPIGVAFAAGNIYVAYFTSWTGAPANVTIGAHGMPTCGVALAIYNGASWAYKAMTATAVAPIAGPGATCNASGTASLESGRWLSVDATTTQPAVVFAVRTAATEIDPHFRSCADAACVTVNAESTMFVSGASAQFGRWNRVHLDASGAVAVSLQYEQGSGLTQPIYGTASSLTNANVGGWSFFALETSSTTDVGRFLNMATDAAGTARFFVYRDLTNHTARYVRCALSGLGACTLSGPALLADAASSDYGRGAVAAYDSNGFPRIAYLDAANSKVRVVAYDNAVTFTKTAEFGATASPAGLSMAFGNSLNLAYAAPTTPALKFFAGP